VSKKPQQGISERKSVVIGRDDDVVLLFTAPTHEKLKTADPAKFPDPTKTAGWERKRRITFEYVFAD
jgi:hypothetical protein